MPSAFRSIISHSNTQEVESPPNFPQRPLVTVMAEERMLHKTGRVETIIGYSFTDPLILWEALQATGSGIYSAGNRRFPEGNKRLSMLGNAVLKLVLVEDWYGTLEVRGKLPFLATTVAPASDTGLGRLHDIAMHVVTTDNLDRIGRLYGLDDLVSRKPAQRGEISQETMAATVEAILGAVYLDGGVHHASLVMHTLGLVAT